jgi:site-specific recombinase XerD
MVIINKGNDDLELLDPETGMKLYLDHKATDCTKSTVQNHRYRMKPFVEWCEKQGVDNLNDLSGRDIQEYRLWRNDDSDINALTLRMQMSTLRVFLKWAGSMEAVPEDLYTGQSDAQSVESRCETVKKQSAGEKLGRSIKSAIPKHRRGGGHDQGRHGTAALYTYQMSNIRP